MDNLTFESLSFDCDLPRLEEYLERFELYILCRDSMTDEKKTALFLTLIGREGYSTVKNLLHPVSPLKAGYDAIKKALLNHMLPQTFESAERAKFNSLMRKSGETIRAFIL